LPHATLDPRLRGDDETSFKDVFGFSP